MTNILYILKLTPNAIIPTKGSAMSIGFDLYSAYDYIIPKQNKKLIKTDISIQLPDGCYGRIAPRSGLALNNFIDIGGGVIDPDYRGNISVILFNFGEHDYKVAKGDRIAQLICEKAEFPKIEERFNPFMSTARQDDGLGSSGI